MENPLQEEQKKQAEGVGPIAAVVIIVAVILLGGIYFFLSEQQKSPQETPSADRASL